MSMDPPVRAGRLALLLTLVALLAVPTWSTSTAPGFAPGSHETHAHAPRAWADQVASLKFVPEDAAFYFSFQRCREQFEIVRASRSWRAVANMPSVKDLWQEFDKQWQGPEGDLARVRIFLEQKDNQQLLEVLADMVSHEVFFVGGSNWVDLVHILAEGYGAMALAPAMAMFENFGVAGPDDVNRAQMRALLTTLSEYSEDLTIPDLVVGFHLKGDQAAAEAQIRRLELLGGLLVSFVPELKDTLKRKKIGETNFLVFSLDFEKLPLGEIDLSEYEDEPDEFEDLIDRLKEMKLSIGLGVKDGCLVLVIGEELEETLEGLLEGPRLADSEHFKPVLPHLGKRVVSLSFISEEMGFGTGWSEDQVEEMVDSFESMLEEAPLSEEQRERLLKDVKQMFEDLAPFQATPGPGLAVSLLVEDGIESYAWDYGKYPGRLGEAPLPVLNHVGGSPILALATRTGGWVESYRNFAKWTRKGYGWFDEIATELAPEEFTVNYKKVMKVAEPICRRLDETTEKLLLPALADGQTAFVLDAKITSTQWQALMPESKKPLPLPEFALVCGVSDAGKLRQAFSAYRAAGNELFAKLHELFPDEVQPFEIPEPTTARIDEGTLYYYPLPSMLGFDEQIQPNAGLNDRVAVLTLSKEHSGRLLRSTPLAARFAALRDSRRPIHAATYFSFQELLAGVEPWVDFVLSEAPELQGDVLPNEVRTQIMQGLRIARVLGTYESITYEEGSAWVTHGKWTVQDLKD